MTLASRRRPKLEDRGLAHGSVKGRLYPCPGFIERNRQDADPIKMSQARQLRFPPLLPSV
ncbi:hypothetical protein GCM10023166_24900 [Paeniglutamicibacter cryotolerans]